MNVHCGTAFGGQSIEGAPKEHWSELYVDLTPLTNADEEFLRNLSAAYDVENRQLALRPSPDRAGAKRFSLVLVACGKPVEETAPDG